MTYDWLCYKNCVLTPLLLYYSLFSRACDWININESAIYCSLVFHMISHICFMHALLLSVMCRPVFRTRWHSSKCRSVIDLWSDSMLILFCELGEKRIYGGMMRKLKSRGEHLNFKKIKTFFMNHSYKFMEQIIFYFILLLCHMVKNIKNKICIKINKIPNDRLWRISSIEILLVHPKVQIFLSSYAHELPFTS
jgi:hypothetical protein